MSRLVAVFGVLGFALIQRAATAGPLTPPLGPVTPTMKTLQEIEPRIAVQTLPGSATAVHVISQAGSYYLAGDVLGVSGKHGIEIVVGGVSLDLRGFRMVGIAGSLDGVSVAVDATVENGTVGGWGGAGVNVCNTALLRGLRAIGNSNGFLICRGEAVGCVAQQNQNGFVAFGALIRDCTATSNAATGFSMSNGSTIQQCVASSNARGVVAGGGCLISGCTAFGNSVNGIEIADACRVVGNTADSNTNEGIFAYANGNTIDGNSLTRNGTALRVTSTSSLIVRNMARGNSAGYQIAGGNDYAQIVSSPGANFSVSNPWANFIDVATPTCSDGIANGGETDVDCGGATACPRCAAGQTCGVASDCLSGICQAGVCQPGGCQTAADCPVLANASASCVSSQCQYACDAGYSDCNANTVDGCEVYVLTSSQHCGQCNSPCGQNQSCINGTCQAGPDCTNGTQDGSETDVDCGGGQCPPCNVGQNCQVGTDCVSGFCASGVCVP